MFRNVLACSGMFRVPGFIDAPCMVLQIKLVFVVSGISIAFVLGFRVCH